MGNITYMKAIWTIIAVALCIIALKDNPFAPSVNAQQDQVLRMALCNVEGTACADVVGKAAEGMFYNAIAISQ